MAAAETRGAGKDGWEGDEEGSQGWLPRKREEDEEMMKMKKKAIY